MGFWSHAKSVFNTEFHTMNTNLHSLVLFLHPLCQQLAILQAAKSHTFQDFFRITLEIACRWKWSLESASELLHDLKEYHLCKGLFVGGKADAKDWWEELLIKGTIHLLKTFAIQIFIIVPHVAEVEQLFSNLSSIQGVKHCNLTVKIFEKLSKL